MKTIRRVEADILDQEFLKYQLIYRRQDDAIPHLLKVMGDFWRQQPDPTWFEEPGAKAKFDAVLGGLGHCIRWVLNSSARRIQLPKASWAELDSEALKLLGWGIHYHMLYVDHVAWSRGLMQASVNETDRMIEFRLKFDFDKRFYYAQLLDSEDELQAQADRLSLEALQSDFPTWERHVSFDGHAFQTIEDTRELDTSYAAVVKWLETVVLPEVNSSEDLGGYSLNEFRRFFAALFLHCEYWTWIEDAVDRRFGNEHELGTVLTALQRPQMLKWLHRISRVDLKSLEAIVDNLLFDSTNPHAHLLNQPFVQSSRGIVYLLPRLFARADPLRMLSGALNKSNTGRRAYERLVQSVSSTVLSQITSSFDEMRFSVWQEAKFRDKSGREYSPDLLVLDKATGELLIGDYKHSISPMGPSEVGYKMAEFDKGLRQIRSYLKGLDNSSDWVSSLSYSKVFAMLVFRHPMLLPVSLDQDIVVVNWAALSKRLLPRYHGSLVELCDWARIRPEYDGRYGPLRTEWHEIHVADWTYRREIVVGD